MVEMDGTDLFLDDVSSPGKDVSNCCSFVCKIRESCVFFLPKLK